jgi:hypothetical protein
MPAFELARWWKPLGLVMLLAAATIYRSVLIHQRNSARAQAAVLRGQVADLTASNAAFQRTIAEQNTAVENLRRQMAEAARTARANQQRQSERASVLMARHYQSAAAIEKAIVPSGCEGAIKWGNAQAPELGRW